MGNETAQSIYRHCFDFAVNRRSVAAYEDCYNSTGIPLELDGEFVEERPEGSKIEERFVKERLRGSLVDALWDDWQNFPNPEQVKSFRDKINKPIPKAFITMDGKTVRDETWTNRFYVTTYGLENWARFAAVVKKSSGITPDLSEEEIGMLWSIASKNFRADYNHLERHPDGFVDGATLRHLNGLFPRDQFDTLRVQERYARILDMDEDSSPYYGDTISLGFGIHHYDAWHPYELEEDLRGLLEVTRIRPDEAILGKLVKVREKPIPKEMKADITDWYMFRAIERTLFPESYREKVRGFYEDCARAGYNNFYMKKVSEIFYVPLEQDRIERGRRSTSS